MTFNRVSKNNQEGSIALIKYTTYFLFITPPAWKNLIATCIISSNSISSSCIVSQC